MALYIALPCSQCRRILRVRTEYLGQRVVCQHCNYGFLVPGDGDPMTAAPFSAELPVDQERVTRMEQELKQVRNELAVRSSDHGTATLKLQEAREEITRLRASLQDLQGQRDQVRDQARAAEAQLRQLREAQAELEQLRARTEALNEQQANQLAQDLQLSRKELARLQAEREVCRANHRIDQAAAEATATEL